VKIQPGLRASAFSTNPQRSSQQQGLEMYSYLTAVVKAFVFVKILVSPAQTLTARNPQPTVFPQRPGHLRALYLAKKRVQYVSGLFQRGKAT
jgi:hypothetical protein